MKKLVVLLALLAMSSMASAGLMLTAAGSTADADAGITLFPSDYIMIGMAGDGASLNGTYFIGVLVEGPGHLDLATIGTQNLVYGGAGAYIMAGTEYAEALGIQSPYAHVALDDVVTGNPLPLTGILVKDLIFHCDGPGEVIVKIFDANGETLDTMIITQDVPEPMTLGLLGLGGLFLRRRLA